MSEIVLQNLEKKYGTNAVVKDVNLTVKTGEFVTLLGPSGSGKTTTLRMIAGLERSSAGSIWIGGRLVSSEDTYIPTYRRRLGMVFQSYAVWPHMTVAENVAFPLTQVGIGKAERQTMVIAVLGKVGLEALSGRYPSQLSGGQQQRVALARAIVGKPEVILFDEPLSNLDAQLRESMRELLYEVHKELGITSVYVTHDQSEAMVLSDRICIMNEGRLLQSDTPQGLFNRPRDLFVAKFIGNTNILPIKTLDTPSKTATTRGGVTLRVGSIPERIIENVLMIRPHVIKMARQDDGANVIEGVLKSTSFIGDRLYATVDLGAAGMLRADFVAGEVQLPSTGAKLRLVLPPDNCVVL